MKDYFYYKEGSWWVYVNVKNNTYDSMWVKNHSINTHQGGDELGSRSKCFELGKIIIAAKEHPGFYIQLSNISEFGDRFHFSSITQKVGRDVSFTFLNGQIETTNNPRPYHIETKDSITIQNKMYNDLICINSIDLLYDNIIYRVYAKRAGLIKYTDRDSNQWELIRYNINQ